MTDPNRDNVLRALQSFRAAGASISQVAAKINMLAALAARYIAVLVADGEAINITAPGSTVKRFRAVNRRES